MKSALGFFIGSLVQDLLF